MGHRVLAIGLILCKLSVICFLHAVAEVTAKSNDSNQSLIHGIMFSDSQGFDSPLDAGCEIGKDTATVSPRTGGKASVFQPFSGTLKVPLRQHPGQHEHQSNRESIKKYTYRDISRIHFLNRKNTGNRHSYLAPNLETIAPPPLKSDGVKHQAQLMATLESGVSLGSGEYFMDVFIGTPPKHFSLILDTGSDLNWMQCAPCRECFEQRGPYFNPNESSSFRNISCRDPRCELVDPPDPNRTCKSPEQTCEYFYWYGDHSNTTGDLALESFTVNLTAYSESRLLENVIFGCGHWNRGRFHGAAGLLGFGRGPLSFATQLREVYGHVFSYCLVDRNSDMNITSKLIFGEDGDLLGHPGLNFTSFISGKERKAADTYYYVQIKGIIVGTRLLNIRPEVLQISPEGLGGTIIDSGTTLSYFAEPAYGVIKEAFEKQVDYPMVVDFPVLSPCYNVSAVKTVELPEFSIVFKDGAVWDFPAENYFIKMEPEGIICLAILGTPKSSLSIIGNYQQQNFQIVYDTKMSRLGFGRRRCADV